MGISWAKNGISDMAWSIFQQLHPTIYGMWVCLKMRASIVTSIKFGRATGVLNYEKSATLW